MTRKQFNARAFERELVDAGYMPLYEYIRRWGEGYEDEALSSRVAHEAARSVGGFVIKWDWERLVADAARPKDNPRERADD